MKLIIDIEKDYYEILKYMFEHGDDYKPHSLIAKGIPYEEYPTDKEIQDAMRKTYLGGKENEDIK